jgi:DNA-directed RNA polymerase subunit M/transcription elongation factor TFIIS
MQRTDATTDRERQRTKRDELPIYEHRRFRCPECGYLEFKMRSKRDADGVSTQDRTCLNCKLRFWLIVE